MTDDRGGARRGRSTIREVALDAQVSVATVSKVLRRAPGVSNSVRARVEESIRRLSYRPLPAARAMRGRSFTLGVILPDIRNPFYADVLDGIQARLAGTHYQPLLGASRAEATLEMSVVESMIDRQIDGLVFVAPRLTRAQLDDVASRVPLVVLGQHLPDMQTFDTVNNDDRLGAELVVDHLCSRGYRDILMVSPHLQPSKESPLRTVAGQRELGYQSAMTRQALAEHIRVERVPRLPDEMRAALRMVLADVRPRAIFCWMDSVALEAIGIARELGLAIPQDVAIVGYDNSSSCELPQNSLTSVNQFGRELGQRCVHLLLQRIEGQQRPIHFVVSPDLVVRRST